MKGPVSYVADNNKLWPVLANLGDSEAYTCARSRLDTGVFLHPQAVVDIYTLEHARSSTLFGMFCTPFGFI